MDGSAYTDENVW